MCINFLLNNTTRALPYFGGISNFVLFLKFMFAKISTGDLLLLFRHIVRRYTQNTHATHVEHQDKSTSGREAKKKEENIEQILN